MSKTPANSNKPCPICGKPPAEKFKPFCSARCADVDLHRWLGEVYRVESDDRADSPDTSERD
ncbi:MAG: DNA gyrase inhibitor YacG [Magnetospirillum sp.]|nr:DNA gyrase inhibitor YacG [Magnetospirillum sp.]